MKTCCTCKEKLPIDSFHKNKRSPDGRSGQCKSCCKIYKQKYRNTPEAKGLARQYVSDNKEKYKLWNMASRKKNYKTYLKTKMEYRKSCPEKIKARQILNNAIATGKVKRLPCTVCGENKSEGHHKDYSKPLEVVWLCNTHHNNHHKLLCLT